jgi:hypothetical protein
MCESLNFKGLEHFSMGNATLQLDQGKLLINNLIDPFDGVLIKTSGFNQWVLNFNPISITPNVNIENSIFTKDGYNRIKAYGQIAAFYDLNLNSPVISVNSKLLPNTFEFVGELNGEIVFTTVFDNSNPPSNVNWIIVAIAIATLVVTAVDYKHIIKKNAQGKVIEETTEWSFGAAGIVTPMGTGGGNQHEIDHCYIRATKIYNPSLPNILENAIENIQLSLNGLSEIELVNEIYS